MFSYLLQIKIKRASFLSHVHGVFQCFCCFFHLFSILRHNDCFNFPRTQFKSHKIIRFCSISICVVFGGHVIICTNAFGLVFNKLKLSLFIQTSSNDNGLTQLHYPIYKQSAISVHFGWMDKNKYWAPTAKCHASNYTETSIAQALPKHRQLFKNRRCALASDAFGWHTLSVENWIMIHRSNFGDGIGLHCSTDVPCITNRW